MRVNDDIASIDASATVAGTHRYGRQRTGASTWSLPR